jgi:hypothetical protein
LETKSIDSVRGRSNIRYDVSNNGDLVRVRHPEINPTLMGTTYLPAMQRALSDLFPYSRKPVVFDLTSHTISRPWPAITHVDRGLRSLFLWLYRGYWDRRVARSKIREPRFKIQMKSQELRATFDRFTALKSWASEGRPPWNYVKPVSIVLKFEISNQNVGLTDLRIEVTELVVATLSLSLKTTISIQLHRFGLNGQQISVEKAYSTIFRLRRALLVFLFEVITAHRARQRGTCPKVWIDGQLRIREAEFCSGDGSASFMTNSMFKWNPSKLNKAKENAISQLVDRKLRRFNFRRYWEDLFRQDNEVNKEHETLLSFTVFFSLIVNILVHPEQWRRDDWNDDIIHYAPYLELRELRS